MDVSVDTNILIHLYQANSKVLLLSSFGSIYAYEYLIDEELYRNDKECYKQVNIDIDEGRIIKVTNLMLIDMGIKGLFDDHYRDYKMLFAGDRGEAYAVALAIVFGIEAFVSDDTKFGGPHETLLKELIDDVIPFTFYELLFLKYLKSETNCNEFEDQFNKISKTMTNPMEFRSRINRVIKRFNKKHGSIRDYQWLQDFCDENKIDLRSRLVELVGFMKTI